MGNKKFNEDHLAEKKKYVSDVHSFRTDNYLFYGSGFP